MLFPRCVWYKGDGALFLLDTPSQLQGARHDTRTSSPSRIRAGTHYTREGIPGLVLPPPEAPRCTQRQQTAPCCTKVTSHTSLYTEATSRTFLYTEAKAVCLPPCDRLTTHSHPCSTVRFRSWSIRCCYITLHRAVSTHALLHHLHQRCRAEDSSPYPLRPPRAARTGQYAPTTHTR